MDSPHRVCHPCTVPPPRPNDPQSRQGELSFPYNFPLNTQIKVPIKTSTQVDAWIKDMWYIYTMEYYSAVKKERNLTLCNNTGGPRGHCAK